MFFFPKNVFHVRKPPPNSSLSISSPIPSRNSQNLIWSLKETPGDWPTFLDLSMDPSESELGRQEMDWPGGSRAPTSDSPRAAPNCSGLHYATRNILFAERIPQRKKKKSSTTTNIRVTFQLKQWDGDGPSLPASASTPHFWPHSLGATIFRPAHIPLQLQTAKSQPCLSSLHTFLLWRPIVMVGAAT